MPPFFLELLRWLLGNGVWVRAISREENALPINHYTQFAAIIKLLYKKHLFLKCFQRVGGALCSF